MATIILDAKQVELLRDLGLPTELSTDMGAEQLDDIKRRLYNAARAFGPGVDPRTKVRYVLRCQDIIRAIDEAMADEFMSDEEKHWSGIVREKMDIACDVLRRADFMLLEPGLPGGAPEGEYDWEARLIGRCTPKSASVDLASRVVAYVLSKSFNSAVEAHECEDIARELLTRFPDDHMDPDEYGWFVLKQEIDGQLVMYERFMPLMREVFRIEGLQAGADYESMVSIHLLTRMVSDEVLRQEFGDESTAWQEYGVETWNLYRMGICPRCGLRLVRRKGRYGMFVRCSGYPNCRYSRGV